MYHLVSFKAVFWDLFSSFCTLMTCLMYSATQHAPFADDAKCSRVVRNPEDCTALRRDLTSVSKWSNDWGLSFNSNKCEVIRISRERRSLLEFPMTVSPYTIDDHASTSFGHLVKRSRSHIVNNKLTWNRHICSVVAKANKTLDFLYTSAFR